MTPLALGDSLAMKKKFAVCGYLGLYRIQHELSVVNSVGIPAREIHIVLPFAVIAKLKRGPLCFF
jgi:hypothetical protein